MGGFKIIPSLCRSHCVPYCMKCGVIEEDHNEEFCQDFKYPALMGEYCDLVLIADEYHFDLTKANENQTDHGRHGAQMGDILLDACGLIKAFREHGQQFENLKESENPSLSLFVVQGLRNWGYDETEDPEDQKIFDKFKEAVNQ